MSEGVLIDTNAYVAYRTGDARMLAVLGRAEKVYLSLFVRAELLTGFRGGSRDGQNRSELEQFLSKSTVAEVFPTRQTAEFFSMIKTNLTRKGRPIPINDVWIAAHCMELGTTLVSLDAHFGEVEGLLRWVF